MDAVKEGYYNRLKNQLFGCLCEREEGHSWEANLDAILIELLGIPEKERTINYYRIYSKLAAIQIINILERLYLMLWVFWEVVYELF